MNVSLEKKIAVGLAAAFILLLGIGFVSYRSTTNLIDRETRVAHAHAVREAIEHLQSLMEDLEARQRTDLLTGEKQYLESYREASHSLEAVLGNLADLTRDNRTQQEQLLALRPLIDLQLIQLNEEIDSRNAGRIKESEQMVRLRTGTETMDKILMVLGKMREQEQVLLINWSKQADGAASFTYALILGGTFVTLVLAIGGGALIFSDLSKRRRVERDLLAERARQELILRTLPVVMYSAKPSGDYGALWVSENIEAVTGFAASSPRPGEGPE
jgi:CHASE3 domain sensor protein